MSQDRPTILQGDCQEILPTLPAESVHCCITSPPYWGLRDYKLGTTGIGQEPSLSAYIGNLLTVFREVRRVLREDGTLWLNLGDGYTSGNRATWRSTPTGLKPKDLLMIPARVALALQADGWYLRSDIIWHKSNPMPESTYDRCTSAHEHVFLLTKNPRYYFDMEAIKEPAVTDGRPGGGRVFGGRHKAKGIPDDHRRGREWEGQTGGRHKRDVWTIPTADFLGAHFAVFPEALVEPCISAGTSERGCCPQCGAPWTRLVERKRVPTRPGAQSKVHAVRAIVSPVHHAQAVGNRDPQRHCTSTRTVGWRPNPSCRCARRNVLPCTVLDPFVGSGTTAVVAARFGRNCIGIELNLEYVAMAQARIRKALAWAAALRLG